MTRTCILKYLAQYPLLTVGDEPAGPDSVSKLPAQCGYDAIPRQSAAAAIEKSHSTHVYEAVTDIRMSCMTAIEVLDIPLVGSARSYCEK